MKAQGWGYNLVLECLPTMHKALDSIHRVGEKKKREANFQVNYIQDVLYF
jgi:hypothetical protein